MPAQGSGDSARTGNDIYGIGWTVRMQLRLPTDRLNGKVRMVILQVPKGYDPGATYTNVFDNVTGHVLLDPIDKDRVKVIKDKVLAAGIINPGVSTTGKELTRYFKFWVPYKKTIKFWDDGAQDNSMPYDYYVCYYGYDTFGSLVTDVVSNIQSWTQFHYKDV